jgi:hypothetical protein
MVLVYDRTELATASMTRLHWRPRNPARHTSDRHSERHTIAHGARVMMQILTFGLLFLVAAGTAGCRQPQEAPPSASADAAAEPASEPVPQSREMGGAKSVTTFFVTSRGIGRGADLGGLSGADGHCQALADAEGAGDHTWRAYLSVSAVDGQPAIHARDRIGKGPWYNAEGLLIAASVEELHSDKNQINKETAVTERLEPVNGVGDSPNLHDILTGSRADGTAHAASDDLTCKNWTSIGAGRAQVGHHDRRGLDKGVNSWNSVHASRGCSQSDLQATGGAGLFYCFAID